MQVFADKAVHSQEGLIDGIYLHFRGEQAQGLYDSSAHVPVKRIITGQGYPVVLLEKVFYLKVRLAHFDAQVLGFLASGYATTIIIGKHHHRLSNQGGIEYPLAGGIEIVGVAEGKHSFRRYGVSQ